MSRISGKKFLKQLAVLCRINARVSNFIVSLEDDEHVLMRQIL